MENYQSRDRARARSLSRTKSFIACAKCSAKIGRNLAAGEPVPRWRRAERVVAFPRDIEELSEMMRLASGERWRVIPGGRGDVARNGRPAHAV